MSFYIPPCLIPEFLDSVESCFEWLFKKLGIFTLIGIGVTAYWIVRWCTNHIRFV